MHGIVGASMRGVWIGLVVCGAALAQSTGGPGGGGGSAGGGSGAPQGQGSELDLPLSHPRDGQPIPTPVDPPVDPIDEPPPVIYGEEIPAESDTIYYVLDISGSMDWDPASYTGVDGQVRVGPRIDRAKAELVRSILGLARNFSFDVVAYDCSTLAWRPSLQPADDGNKQAAIAWVQALYPRGATGTGPATALALGDKQNKTVVLLTDGAPNCGASSMSGHRSMIRAANTQGARVHVFGIAASGAYRAFCQGVAADNGGGYHDVP